MMNFNPIHYLKHAWEATHSIWGKICIVLFYWFVWVNILSAIWSQISPTTGWECMFGAFSPTDLNMVTATMKVVNLWILGFFLYADRGGIKVWNVFMVWFFYWIQWVVCKAAMEEFLGENCPADLHQLHVSMIVTQIWIFLALVCSCLDHWKGRLNGSTEESSPLVNQAS